MVIIVVIVVDGDKGASNFLLFLLPTDVVEKAIAIGMMIVDDPVVVNPCRPPCRPLSMHHHHHVLFRSNLQ